VIGPNGAGKSTLLKLLNGIIQPDTGRIEIRGRLGALIELGAGFHPLLTGRENVYMQGAILGATKREIDEKFDEIAEFAGIGDFIDTPVKFYSSGMNARLGFSIAIHFDPDVLVVDEVLAVGDMSFQEKCMRRMEQMRARNKAVMMVSHSLYRIEALCDRAIWLDRGRCVQMGKAVDVVKAYLDDQERRFVESVRKELGAPAHGPEVPVTIEGVDLAGEDGAAKDVFGVCERMTVRIRYNAHRRVDWPLFNIRILHRDNAVLEASMLIDGPQVEAIEGQGTVECRLEPLPLTPKTYEVVVFVRAKEGIADIAPMRRYAVFQVGDENLGQWPMNGPMAYNHLRQGSPVYVGRSWHFMNGHTAQHAEPKSGAAS
jgi:ABC-type polysaccharide/polyol phosphate transport system ATPase subunit